MNEINQEQKLLKLVHSKEANDNKLKEGQR